VFDSLRGPGIARAVPGLFLGEKTRIGPAALRAATALREEVSVGTSTMQALMSVPARGMQFEREIREQPIVWECIAGSDRAARLARALTERVVLVGSGSSLFVAQLGALALRRRRIEAVALAATEARLDHNVYEDATVIAISQSGRSTDLLEAIETLRPRTLVALTNTPESPLAARADVAIDVAAGVERAVPASKSVSATAAILLWSASLAGGDGRRDAAVLVRTARAIEAWLASPELRELATQAERIAGCRSVAVLGSDYGLPIASEMALKLKEACYLHAEGFAAGEFRHGSIAMIDATSAVIGVIDSDARAIVERPLAEVAAAGPSRFTIGSPPVPGAVRLGPEVEVPFNTLGWLVTAQTVALYAARARGIESDAPRGLRKALAGTG
jgi:glucosamine--fructose-6-phosphate aminotransferase (isomerizing)